MTHTPGPWTAAADDYLPNITFIHSEQVDTVARIWHGKNKDGNARLIAAAPEMLEALEELIATLDAQSIATGSVGRRAKAAIAKANGESK